MNSHMHAQIVFPTEFLIADGTRLWIIFFRTMIPLHDRTPYWYRFENSSFVDSHSAGETMSLQYPDSY